LRYSEAQPGGAHQEAVEARTPETARMRDCHRWYRRQLPGRRSGV